MIILSQWGGCLNYVFESDSQKIRFGFLNLQIFQTYISNTSPPLTKKVHYAPIGVILSFTVYMRLYELAYSHYRQQCHRC